jgi:tetratricopeptide (TPR) repeat protein
MGIVEAFQVNRVFKSQCTGNPHTGRDYNLTLDELRFLPPRLPSFLGPDLQKLISVEHPYPPCFLNLAALEPVFLSELTMNSHHCGRVLLAKLVGVGDITQRNTYAAIEDTNGDIEYLHVHFVCMNTKTGYAWPKLGTFLAIKEPFLTLEETSRDPCIQLDHPSDLMFAGSWPLSFPINGRQTNALKCKEAGNVALASKDLDAAHTSYTEGIRLTAGKDEPSDQSLRQDLHRNRSHVRLALGRYEGAVEDAVAALTHVQDDTHRKLDAKAYFRAASASYSLKSYDKAALFLGDQLELVPGDKDARTMLNRVQARLHEQNFGHYDVMSIRESISSKPRVDVADFSVNTTIEPSGPERGRGLFATRDLQPGDLIMAETAFCCVLDGEDNRLSYVCNARSPDKLHSGLVGLWRSAVNEAANNPLKGGDLLKLQGNYKGSFKQVLQVDDIAVVDTFNVHDIVACNAFALDPTILIRPNGQKKSATGNSGIWIRLSYINHSCLPNSQRVFHGDLVLVHTSKPIAKGEEITLNYSAGDYKDFVARTEEMESTWGFRCQCAICKADAECAPGDLAERTRLWEEVINMATYLPCKKESLDKMEQHVVRINRTYDAKLYAGLPKGALIMAQAWLVLYHISAGDRSRSYQETANLLRVLGYQVDTQGETICKVSPTKNSLLPIGGLELPVLTPLIDQAVDAHLTGAVDIAKHLLDFAKLSERVGQGTDIDTVQVIQERLRELSRKYIGAAVKG